MQHVRGEQITPRRKQPSARVLQTIQERIERVREDYGERMALDLAALALLTIDAVPTPSQKRKEST